MFCVFFYFFRSVFRDSAISSSDSRGSHFGSSLGNKQLGGSSWKEVLPKQPRFHENIPSINLVSQQMYYRIDGILFAYSKFQEMFNSIASDDQRNDFEPRLPR